MGNICIRRCTHLISVDSLGTLECGRCKARFDTILSPITGNAQIILKCPLTLTIHALQEMPLYSPITGVVDWTNEKMFHIKSSYARSSINSITMFCEDGFVLPNTEKDSGAGNFGCQNDSVDRGENMSVYVPKDSILKVTVHGNVFLPGQRNICTMSCSGGCTVIGISLADPNVSRWIRM